MNALQRYARGRTLLARLLRPMIMTTMRMALRNLWLYQAIMALLLQTLSPDSRLVYAGHGEEPVQTIAPERAKALLDKKEPIFLIDLRTTKEFQQKHLPGARSIPVAELESV